MKKIALVLFVFAFISSSKAQEKGSIEIGGNIGLNFSDVTGEFLKDSRVGINTGVFGEYYFSKSWGLKTKIIYDQKGYSVDFINRTFNDSMVLDPSSFKANFYANYITIPILLNWHFGKKKNWYLNFGPYIGFLTNSSTRFENFDYGFNPGIGYRFNFNKKLNFFVEYDGQLGFKNFGNSSSAIVNTRSSLNIGVLFLLDSL